jgi:hypothetical protein
MLSIAEYFIQLCIGYMDDVSIYGLQAGELLTYFGPFASSATSTSIQHLHFFFGYS